MTQVQIQMGQAQTQVHHCYYEIYLRHAESTSNERGPSNVGIIPYQKVKYVERNQEGKAN